MSGGFGRLADAADFLELLLRGRRDDAMASGAY
jgi:hypothetical protein